jgi:predicted unusual protein kinase regulating ubiquinone biosynthesis (AarF/ABC1/UbiB family)
MAAASAVLRGLALQYSGFEPGPLIAELRERIFEELDYRLEAAQQQVFAGYFADHPFIHVPGVVPELSTTRVLVTELADGVRFSEALEWPQSDRDLAGETIFRFVFTGLYRLHRFNGDPHPGNYLFSPDGRVTFLDFGLCKVFAETEVAQLQALIDAYVLDPDPARFRAAMEDAGFLLADAPVSDDDVHTFFRQFYELVAVDEAVAVGNDYADETARTFFDTTTPEGRMLKYTNIPPEFAVVQRINLGLYGVLAQLGSTANWRRISEEIWPWVDGPPSTPLGQAEAVWRDRGSEGRRR